MSTFQLAIASDHGGFSLKETLRHWLETQGHAVKDFGVFDGEANATDAHRRLRADYSECYLTETAGRNEA